MAHSIRSFFRTASLSVRSSNLRRSYAVNSLQLLQRLHPLQPITAVRTRHIEQYCLQARAGRPEIIDGINVTDIEALLGANIHFAQCSLKNLSPRLLTSKQARIRDGLKATRNAAMFQHGCDLAIGIGNHA